jgi:hypothetical protein
VVTIGNMRVGYVDSMDLDASDYEAERNEISDQLAELFALVARQNFFVGMRHRFAELRKRYLEDGEKRQLFVAASMMPIHEQPVYTEVRSGAELLERTYAHNTDTMNRDEFKLFALSIADGSKKAVGRARGKHLIQLLEYLDLDVFRDHDAETGKFMSRLLTAAVRGFTSSTPSIGVDEEQRFLVACLEWLGKAGKREEPEEVEAPEKPEAISVLDAFEVLSDFVANRLLFEHFDKKDGSATGLHQRFGPVLIAAFDALYSLFETEDGILFWSLGQPDLCWWKILLNAGNASDETMDAFNQLIVDDEPQ